MTVRLIAVRHGQPESEGYEDELLRPLSMEGKEAVQRTIKKLQNAGIKPIRVIASPVLRAKQTGIVIGEMFDVPVDFDEALGYDLSESALVEKLSDLDDGESIIFVGHVPKLPEFVNYVCEGEPLEGLSKGEAVVVEFEDSVGKGEGKLIQTYSP